MQCWKEKHMKTPSVFLNQKKHEPSTIFWGHKHSVSVSYLGYVYHCTVRQLTQATTCLKRPRPVFHNFIQSEALLTGGDFTPFPRLPDLS